MQNVGDVVGRAEQLAYNDWRLGLAAEVLAGDGTILGKAVVLAPNIAVTTASVASRAQSAVAAAQAPNAKPNPVFGPLAIVFPQFHGPTSNPLPARLEAIDGELRFGVIRFSGQPPVAAPTNLLGTGELPADGTECSVVYADHPEKGFFRIVGQLENRPDGKSFYLYMERLPADASQLMGTPVLLEERLLGMIVGGPSRSVANTFILGVTSVRGMALSEAGSAVRALLPWIPDESRVPSPESRVATSPSLAQTEKIGPVKASGREAVSATLNLTREETKPIQADGTLGPGTFARLSPSTRGALGRAEGMRVAMGLKEVHMEQLMVGLYEKYGGPGQRLLSNAKIDETELLKIIREVRDTEIPKRYSPVSLNAFPPLSEHANKAMLAAVRRSAELKAELIRSRHLLYGALSVEECGLVKALQDRGVRKEDIAKAVADEGGQAEKSEKSQEAASTEVRAVEVFYSYSQRDVRFKKPLDKCLEVLQKQGLIKSWSGGSISAGDLAGEIADRLNAADLILLLISQNYLASGFNVAEMKRALERQTAGQARVVLILLRATELRGSPVATLPALPEKPVDEWANHDEGFRKVAEGLRQIIPTIPVAKPAVVAPGPEPTPTPSPTPTPAPVTGFTAAPTPKVDSDLWSEEDQLGYEAYARTIAALITHKDTVPPLTIGIKAPWGAGKTSLMKRVQHLLDGRAEMSEKNRSGARQQGQAPRMTLWRLLRDLKQITKSDNGSLRTGEMPKLLAPSNTEGAERYGLPPRITVWFNAWKYQTSEQIWAGMAHCIISQVTARMSALERERFWLRLHARRVNTDEVRRKVHELLIRALVPAALMIGVGCVMVVWLASLAPLLMPYPWSVRVVTGLAGLIGMIWKARATLGEKAAGTMKELVREPDYEGKMGYLHLVESDIREVLGLVTTASPEFRVASPESEGAPSRGVSGSTSKTPPSVGSRSESKFPLLAKEARSGAPQAVVPSPLVVFVDDLDRCAPNKVAEVVEAINLFLCGDYPNCIFVLGMEPGMVAAALEVANKDVIEKALEMGVADRTAPVGWRFMEKIVQLPIMIPPPTEDGKKAYVKSLVGSVEAVAPDRLEVPKEPPKEEEIEEFVRLIEGGTVAEVEKKSLELVAQAPAEKQKAAAEAGKRVYARTFTERDPVIADFVKDVAELVDGNPRQIKRYVNVFRFYSTLRYGLQADGRAKASELPSDKVLAKFVALTIQWPHAMDCLRAKNCLSGGKLVSRLEYLEAESAKITADDVAGDESWKKIIEGMGTGMGTWAQARTFRNFLARGESLGSSGGHGLW